MGPARNRLPSSGLKNHMVTYGRSLRGLLFVALAVMVMAGCAPSLSKSSAQIDWVNQVDSGVISVGNDENGYQWQSVVITDIANDGDVLLANSGAKLTNGSVVGRSDAQSGFIFRPNAALDPFRDATISAFTVRYYSNGAPLGDPRSVTIVVKGLASVAAGVKYNMYVFEQNRPIITVSAPKINVSEADFFGNSQYSVAIDGVERVRDCTGVGPGKLLIPRGLNEGLHVVTLGINYKGHSLPSQSFTVRRCYGSAEIANNNGYYLWKMNCCAPKLLIPFYTDADAPGNRIALTNEPGTVLYGYGYPESTRGQVPETGALYNVEVRSAMFGYLFYSYTAFDRTNTVKAGWSYPSADLIQYTSAPIAYAKTASAMTDFDFLMATGCSGMDVTDMPVPEDTPGTGPGFGLISILPSLPSVPSNGRRNSSWVNLTDLFYSNIGTKIEWASESPWIPMVTFPWASWQSALKFSLQAGYSPEKNSGTWSGEVSGSFSTQVGVTKYVNIYEYPVSSDGVSTYWEKVSVNYESNLKGTAGLGGKFTGNYSSTNQDNWKSNTTFGINIQAIKLDANLLKVKIQKYQRSVPVVIRAGSNYPWKEVKGWTSPLEITFGATAAVEVMIPSVTWEFGKRGGVSYNEMTAHQLNVQVSAEAVAKAKIITGWSFLNKFEWTLPTYKWVFIANAADVVMEDDSSDQTPKGNG